MSGLIRTWKQSDAARETHVLERTDVGTGQDMETKRGSEGSSLLGEPEGRRRDWSGHRNKARQQGELTSWRWQTSGLIRSQIDSDSMRGTHDLGRV